MFGECLVEETNGVEMNQSHSRSGGAFAITEMFLGVVMAQFHSRSGGASGFINCVSGVIAQEILDFLEADALRSTFNGSTINGLSILILADQVC